VSTEHDDFLPIFLDEAFGRIDTMLDLLAAEEAGTAETVTVLLREAHTLKGAAGIVGLGEVQQIAHAMEEVLAAARETGAGLDPASTAVVKRQVDALRRRLDEAAAAKTDGAPEPEQASTQAGSGSIAQGSLRVRSDKVDRLLDLVGETVLHHRRLEHLLGSTESAGDLDLGEHVLGALQDAALQLRMIPLSSILNPLKRAMGELSASDGKQAELVPIGLDTELDRVLLEGLTDSLLHVVRNALAHGIETPEQRTAAGKPPAGRIELRAEQRDGAVEITVRDDGRGVAPELLAQASGGAALASLLSRPGLSTNGRVTELAGRGVGMDAVCRYVESLGGAVLVSSEPGAGTEVTLRLPLTLVLLDVLLFERGRSVLGVPLGVVQEAVVADVQTLGGLRRVTVREQTFPFADLADVLDADSAPLPQRPLALILSVDEQKIALGCDRLIGEEQVVLKSLDIFGSAVPGYLGGAILGDSSIALILDPRFLVSAPRTFTSRAARPEQRSGEPKLLVVEDSFTIRELQRSILEAAGYRVTTARDGAEALRLLDAEPDVAMVITDIEMPELDGFGLIEAIRRDERRSSLPVMVVSSLDDPATRERGAAVGADSYVVKSAYDQRALLETVEQLVGR